MLKLKIPPVLVTLSFGGLIWLVHYIFPNLSYDLPYQVWLVAFTLFLSAVIGISGVTEFTKRSTTVNPHKPDNAKVLVNDGIYSLSRNPMYLALLLVLIAWVIYLGNMLSLLILPLFVWYMNSYQIEPEEESMARKFGVEYEAYRERVRRWV